MELVRESVREMTETRAAGIILAAAAAVAVRTEIIRIMRSIEFSNSLR
jgi:hypothetical protein